MTSETPRTVPAAFRMAVSFCVTALIVGGIVTLAAAGLGLNASGPVPRAGVLGLVVGGWAGWLAARAFQGARRDAPVDEAMIEALGVPILAAVPDMPNAHERLRLTRQRRTRLLSLAAVVLLSAGLVAWSLGTGL